MRDFFCTNPDEMHYAPLRERARYFKENEKRAKIMSSASEELREEGRMEVAKRLLKMGKLSPEEIAHVASLPLDTVKRLSEMKLA